jgi:hypothetical protein
MEGLSGAERVRGGRRQGSSEQHSRDATAMPENGRSDAHQARSGEQPTNHQGLSNQYRDPSANGPISGT